MSSHAIMIQCVLIFHTELPAGWEIELIILCDISLPGSSHLSCAFQCPITHDACLYLVLVVYLCGS